jgi:hypothetical protein
MSKFKVGDWVVRKAFAVQKCDMRKGQYYEGEPFQVEEFDRWGYVIDPLGYKHGPENLELSSEPPSKNAQGPASAVDPSHYKFGNIQVRDLSAHLTSFGGQAVQYVARATRLDGAVKGNPVEDLKKAITLLKWEIERLEKGYIEHGEIEQ